MNAIMPLMSQPLPSHFQPAAHGRPSLRRLAGASARLALNLTIALALGCSVSSAFAQTGVDTKGLRGIDVAEPDTLPAGTFRSQQDSELVDRNYEQQPPVIPHKIDGYEITLNFNRCMDCHSDARYKEMGATRVSQTHFKTRDGSELTNISPRRYFCVQCHVPQTDARPLVDNTYQRASGAR